MDRSFCCQLRNDLGKPGTFMMGSPTTESGRSSDETQHQVTLTQGFYLGKYEVTQAQYESIMGRLPRSHNLNPLFPVWGLSWDGVQSFLSKLNQTESEKLLDGWAYSLPTEAEWEYACRAGRQQHIRLEIQSHQQMLTTIIHTLVNRTLKKSVVTKRINGVFTICTETLWEWCNDSIGEYP